MRCQMRGIFGYIAKRRVRDSYFHAKPMLYLFPFSVASVELFGARFPLYNGIDSFEMRWVGNHSQSNVLVRDAVESFDVGSQMVLDIT